MFKFIHAADVHLDSPLRGLSVYDEAPVEVLRSASRRAFTKLVDLAIDEQVSFVLLAGDLFDGGWRDFQTVLFLARQLGRLEKENIAVFIVLGNHDAENRMTKRLPTPSNLYVFGSRSAKTVMFERDDVRVAIHGQSFSSTHTDSNLAARYPSAKQGVLNIGMLHTSLDGREGHAPYAPCSLDDLHSKGYQYWALGHVHQQEIVSEDPWVVFPGCLQGRHVRETGPKGCILVTGHDDEIREVEHVELDVLRWAVCQVDVAGVANRTELFNRIERALSPIVDSAGDLPSAVRVRLTGRTNLAAELVDPAFQLEQGVRVVAASLEPDKLWIEKVMANVDPATDHAPDTNNDELQIDLLRSILAIPHEPSAVEGLDAVQGELFSKISDVKTELTREQDFDTLLRGLIRDAKRLLVERLRNPGET